MSAAFDSVAPLAAAGLRFAPPLVLLWLAFFFGRTLCAGDMPLIERVARIGKPDLSPVLCRYTRWLTTLWCIYFVVAAALTAAASLGFEQVSLGVAAVSLVLFVGEYWMRRRLFPQEVFPGFVQQIRDTVRVWRPRSGA